MPRPQRPCPDRRRRRIGPGVEPLERRALLATFTVSSLDDAGLGTLRDAIAQANADPAADVIAFAPGLTGTIALGSALPDLATPIDVEGPGASSLTVARSSADGTPGFRVFTIDPGAVVTIAGLTIRGGGGVAEGGGVRSGGTLTVLDSAIVDNEATGAGGGLYNAADGGSAKVWRSTISGNRAGRGGGIANDGTFLLVNSTVSGNTATAAGGGGIADSGPLSLLATTVAANTSEAVGGAGGIATAPASPSASPPSASLVGTIVAGNLGVPGDADATPAPFDLAGTFTTTSSDNLIGAAADAVGLADGEAGNRVGTPTAPVDAKLGPLADNGGPTPTQALLPGSPAIDAGTPIPAATADQRGVPRGPKPDLGAFEVGRPADAQPAPSDYDGDGISDPAVYSYDPAVGAGRFQVQLSGGGTIDRLFGGADDVPVVGDFDGDGKADIAVYGDSPLNGYSRFAILDSSTGTGVTVPFGGAGDLPAVGDYDGDGITDLAVYGYSPLNGFSRFAIRPSSALTAAYAVPFGGAGDVAAVGDYDGDGKADVAVFGYSPDDGYDRFAILPSGGPSGYLVPFGGPGERPVPGDYDGDGKTDVAVAGYSPADGLSRFAIRPSSDPGAAYPVALGSTIDVPVVGDYDGDGEADPTTFGPAAGGSRFVIRRSSDGTTRTVALGPADAGPLPSPVGPAGPGPLGILLNRRPGPNDPV